MILLAALHGCNASQADAWEAAVASTAPLADALADCEATADRADACRTEVLRHRPNASVDDCHRIQSPKWRAECTFAAAERLARSHDRWGALAACGLAGRYYGECLYHVWTYDMQGSVRGAGRANDEIETGRSLVAYWGQLQTIAGDPTTQMWTDWWYFALNRNQPADLADCARLPPVDAARCERGTLSFVERAIASSLKESATDPRRKSRICRGGIEQLEQAFPDLYRVDERLRERALAGRERGCSPTGPGPESGRPWNPIFLAHRAWSAG